MTKGHRLFYLRNPEIILLRRALRIYANTYEQLSKKDAPKWEKEDLAQMAKAADILAERLMKETFPEDSLPQEIADHLRTVAQNHNWITGPTNKV